ncbi:MAG: Rieske 2Fe-2S domain-containing protein [Candidatus Neomarinimicrobiota bacterium]|tara:strand:+ start:739 stop:1200 length:462 start_codon:yes stop_codon:yes gene_type:complete
MDRRDFIKSTCSAACACIGVSAVSLLQSCEDNKAYEQNVDGEDFDTQLSIDISQSPHQNLESIGGTSVLSPNSIDSLGLLLVRSSADNINAFSRRCTHSSYSVNAFNSEGLAVCSSGHGGSFNTSGNVAVSPPSARLTSYNTSLINNTLTISK